MKKTTIRDFVVRYEWIFVALLLILGSILRLVWLDTLPVGLNQDEASAGYEAWAVLNHGTDRCGNEYPLLLESWGSGQNALYSYLAMPLIALLGLSVLSLRLVAALAGICTLIVFWLLARHCRGRGFGLCALFILVVNPWHIMISRWALESNLLPLFLLLGVYLTVLSRKKQWALPLAALSFALSLYAYGTAFLFLPVFLIWAVIWLWKKGALKGAAFPAALGVFVAAALPIAACQLLNAFGGGPVKILGMTLPALSQTRQAATTVLGGGDGPLQNYRDFLILLWSQRDGLSFNAMKGHGLYYFFGLPLAVLGLMVSLGGWREHPDEAPLIAGLLVCFAVSPLVNVNINRINMVFLPILYFSSLGMYIILKKLKGYSILPVAAILISLTLFLRDYNEEFRVWGNASYFPGLGQAIQYAVEQKPESVCVTGFVNQPYIFALFYTKTPPGEFIDTVDYADRGSAFRQVKGFGIFRFGDWEDSRGEMLILHWSEAGDKTKAAKFGDYVVCWKQEKIQ